MDGGRMTSESCHGLLVFLGEEFGFHLDSWLLTSLDDSLSS